MDLTYDITDDSGFMALADPDRYQSFVHKEWDFDELVERFLQEMRNNALIIWSTGLENTWTVRFSDRPTDATPFRQFEKVIEVTNGRLVLTNYEDLTMAAQFEDEKIPSRHNADLLVGLANGRYTATVRQMVHPDRSFDMPSGEVHFEIVLSPVISDGPVGKQVDDIFWSEL